MKTTLKAISLKTNGKYEIVQVKDYENYEEYVEGPTQRVPFKKQGYINPQTKMQCKLSCYANEMGMITNLPSNPWAGLLSLFGASLFQGIFLFGNLLLLSKNQRGGDCDIDDYIIHIVKKFSDCHDEDTFYIQLKKTLKTSLITFQQDKKKKEEKEKDEGKSTISSLPIRTKEIPQNCKRKLDFNNSNGEDIDLLLMPHRPNGNKRVKK
jgi:hypothetical protein